jgi:hypothetical protein
MLHILYHCNMVTSYIKMMSPLLPLEVPNRSDHSKYFALCEDDQFTCHSGHFILGASCPHAHYAITTSFVQRGSYKKAETQIW